MLNVINKIIKRQREDQATPETKEGRHKQISDRAYHIWLAEGQPDGKAELHWLQAEDELFS